MLDLTKSPTRNRDVFVIISEFEGEDLQINVYWTLAEAKAQACDMSEGMGAERVRVYRVFADPDPENADDRWQQLNEREHFDFDEALATA